MPPRTTRRPSMADVGRLAGVSAQTISRYYSGDGYVSEETRSRIAEAVASLGYVPNRAAGSLRALRTRTLGVLNVGELNYGAAQILSGISAAAREAGRTLMIAEVDAEPGAEDWATEVRAALDHLLSAPVDGIIVSTALQGVEELLGAARARVPVVNLSERPRYGAEGPRRVSSVGGDATRHLIGLGHTRIAHLVGPRTRVEALDRERGYLAAMAEAGLEPLLLEGAIDWWATSGALAADRMGELTATAVFAGNDELALGFLGRMQARGLEAPRDFSLVGVDDMPAAAFLHPPLTTIRIDFLAVGREAFAAAFQAVETGVVPEMVPLPAPLTVRSSTAAPPPAPS